MRMSVTRYVPSILQRFAIVPPSIMALIISAAILSKRSAPLAAQSPTLSPTFKSNQFSVMPLEVQDWKLNINRKKQKHKSQKL